MTRRLLDEPHVLAHELRTPLTVLAGWYSLIREEDISPNATPEQWATAMEACQEAVARLNLIINEACNEATSARRRRGPEYDHIAELLERTQMAVIQSREVLARIQRSRSERAAAPETRPGVLENGE